ncbi:MAG: pantoate--beta-alanine ligase [Magnetococcales bacterium]|nr:pantoate--beta-alanine ligase [Magnetococcales bacterium]
MEILNRGDALQAWTAQMRAEGLRVGFVPTMGALHEGHLTLIRKARQACDRVLASIFVNPTQFGPGEDYDRYPRDEARDRALLEGEGCDALFLPTVEEIYPTGRQTVVRVGAMSRVLCGASRPGHFEGVTTVVAILLNRTQPQRLYLGLKDYQQVCVISRMVQDLGMPVEVVGVETVREADGLALSSRNRYLTSEQRQQATALNRALEAVRARYRQGERGGETLSSLARAVLMESGLDRIDYVALCQSDTLLPLPQAGEDPIMLLAVHVGGARLIDNRFLARD